MVMYRFDQMSRYLDIIQRSLDQHFSEIDKAYDENIAHEMEEEEYYSLKDEYTDKFIEAGRDFPDLFLSSFVIAWYSFIEQELADICRSLRVETDTSKKIKNEKGIRRSRKLLLEVAKYEIDPANWQELVEIGRLRNFIVHNGNTVHGHIFSLNDKEIVLVSHIGSTYYFSIDPVLFKYLKKHEIVEQTISHLYISLTFNYCKYLVEFGETLLAKLHSDLHPLHSIELQY